MKVVVTSTVKYNQLFKFDLSHEVQHHVCATNAMDITETDSKFQMSVTIFIHTATKIPEHIDHPWKITVRGERFLLRDEVLTHYISSPREVIFVIFLTLIFLNYLFDGTVFEFEYANDKGISW